LLEEEIISEEEDVLVVVLHWNLRSCSFRRVRESTLRMKELELKEKELAMQMKLKELEAKTLPSPEPVSKSAGFDISKHVHFVPLFKSKR